MLGPYTYYVEGQGDTEMQLEYFASRNDSGNSFDLWREPGQFARGTRETAATKTTSV